MRVAVIGTGYVGLVTGTCLANVGHEVTCVDNDPKKLEKLDKGISPIYEPGLDAIISRNIEAGRLKFTGKLVHALDSVDIVFIAVGTPQSDDDAADLSYVMAAAREIAEAAQHEFIVVCKSTVPVGTNAKVQGIIDETLAKDGKKIKLAVVSNPEFLKEGKAVEDFQKPDRIIVGVTDDSQIAPFTKLYKPFIVDDPGKLLFMNRESAELTKYAANAMLAIRVSFMNEISRLCDAVGANIDSVRIGIGADSRIGKKSLYAGPGYGGSCFPKDISALICIGEEAKVPLEMIRAVKAINQKQREYSVEKIKEAFGGNVKDKKIALWGLAFKPGTDDVRQSPAIFIAQSLIKAGAKIVAHDPKAIETFKEVVQDRVEYFSDEMACIKDVDALVLVTEWGEYKFPDWRKIKTSMKGNLIVDLRNQYDRGALESDGFKYFCIGRPAASTTR
jgi:UDPglucose 6-dehydrogenase